MAKRKLNRNRPYGEVYGIAGHRYEQDGFKFDPAGICINCPEDIPTVDVEDAEEVKESPATSLPAYLTMSEAELKKAIKAFGGKVKKGATLEKLQEQYLEELDK